MRSNVIFAFLTLAASFVAANTGTPPAPACPTPACPTPSCAACPAGQTQTLTRPSPGACQQCGCTTITTGVPPPPSCPTYSCAACPAGQSQTFTRPAPTACAQCACVKPTTTNTGGSTTTKPTITTITTPASCPTMSCAACPAGQTQTQTRSAPGACLKCACANPTTWTTKPITTKVSTTTPLSCPTPSCAACPLGQSQTQTPGANGCLQCGCVVPTTGLGTTTVPPTVPTGTPAANAAATTTASASTDSKADAAAGLSTSGEGVLNGNGASGNHAATSLLGVGSILSFVLAFL